VCPCLQTLMYNAGLYGRAQALRKEGTAPAGGCSFKGHVVWV